MIYLRLRDLFTANFLENWNDNKEVVKQGVLVILEICDDLGCKRSRSQDLRQSDGKDPALTTKLGSVDEMWQVVSLSYILNHCLLVIVLIYI